MPCDVHRVYHGRRRGPLTIWLEYEPYGANLPTFHFKNTWTHIFLDEDYVYSLGYVGTCLHEFMGYFL